MDERIGLDRATKTIGPDLALVLNPSGEELGSWRDYVSDDRSVRLERAHEDMDQLAAFLPKSAAAIKPHIVDAFLAQMEKGSFGKAPFRVIMFEKNDILYARVSLPPVGSVERQLSHPILDRGPERLADLYVNVCNGFTNPYLQTGPLPLSQVLSITDPLSDREEADWFETIQTRTLASDVFEVMNNGGSIQVLLDLNADHEGQPFAIWADTDDGITKWKTPLFPLMDAITQVGIEA